MALKDYFSRSKFFSNLVPSIYEKPIPKLPPPKVPLPKSRFYRQQMKFLEAHAAVTEVTYIPEVKVGPFPDPMAYLKVRLNLPMAVQVQTAADKAMIYTRLSPAEMTLYLPLHHYQPLAGEVSPSACYPEYYTGYYRLGPHGLLSVGNYYDINGTKTGCIEFCNGELGRVEQEVFHTTKDNKNLYAFFLTLYYAMTYGNLPDARCEDYFYAPYGNGQMPEDVATTIQKAINSGKVPA